VIYKDHNEWMIRSVPIQKYSFDNRAPFPEPWRGLRDDVLSNKIGIDGCIFVHATGFIGGNKTIEGALEMSRKTLSLKKN